MRIRNKKILTGKKIIKILKEHSDILVKYKVKRIGLFGSFVKGKQKTYSDIDFLVEFDMSAFDNNFKGLSDSFMGLAFYLEDLFGRKVELVTNGSLSPYIQPYVEKEVRWYEARPAIS